MAVQAVKYMVDVDSKGAVTGIRAAADEADRGGQKFTLLNDVLKGMKLGIGLDIWGTIKDAVKGAAAAIPELIARTGEYAGQLLKTNSSLKIGFAAQQDLARAGADVGVSMESNAKSIKNMMLVLEKQPELVKSIGLSWDDLKKKAPEEQYEAIGTAIAGIEDPIQRTKAATDFFGKSGTEVLALFEGAIDDAREANEKFALTMDKQTAEAADRLADNIELGGEAFGGMGRNIAGAIASSEPFQVLVEGILDVIGWLSRTIKENQSVITEWVSAGVFFALDALQKFSPAMDVAIAVFASFATAANIAAFALKAVVAGLIAQVQALTNPRQAWDTFKASLADAKADFDLNRKAIEDVSAAAMQLKDKGVGALTSFTNKVRESGTATNLAADATQRHTQYTKENTKELEKATLANSKHAEDSRAAWDNFYSGLDKMRMEDTAALIKDADKRADAVIQNLDRIAAEQSKARFEEIEMAIEAHAQVGQNMKDFWKSVEEEQKRRLEAQLDSISEWGDAIGSVGDLFETLGLKGARSLQEIGNATGLAISGWKAYKEGASGAAKAALLAQGAQQAYNSTLLGGAAAGAAAGAAYGPFGIAVGAVGGALLSWIGSAKRAREEAARVTAEITKSRSAFIAAAGGIDLLKERAKSAGATLDHLFDAKTVQEYEAAVKELTDTFDLQKQAQEELNALMEKYDLKISDLGPKFSQQKLDEQAMTLIHDWEWLSRVVGDHGVALEKIAPEMSKYVQAVIAAGGTIPENLRPVIADLIRLGLLTDEAGGKITDISQINFADTIEASVKSLINTIKDLINVMLGVPREVHTDFTSSRSGGGGSGEGGDAGIPGKARGGILTPRPGGHIIRAAEAGSTELVAPVQAFSRQLASDLARVVGSSSAASGGGGDVHIYVDQKGNARQISPAEARRLQETITGGGIKISSRSVGRRVA